MFMTAPDIKSRVTESPDRGEFDEHGVTETMGQMWDRKWEQAQHTGLAQSIQQDGFEQVNNRWSTFRGGREKPYGGSEHVPIHLHRDGSVQLADNHHRVEAMSRLHPQQFLNVDHGDGTGGSTSQWAADHRDANFAKHGMHPGPPSTFHDVRLGSMR